MRRKDRRAILAAGQRRDSETRLITFGQPASPCTLYGRPAVFAECMECEYRHGSRGLGIVCGHRFGVDPTYIDGRLTQLCGDEILPLDEV